jgi:hypothetical protein
MSKPVNSDVTAVINGMQSRLMGAIELGEGDEMTNLIEIDPIGHVLEMPRKTDLEICDET